MTTFLDACVYVWLALFAVWAIPSSVLVVCALISRASYGKPETAQGGVSGALRIAHRGGREEEPENTMASVEDGATFCDMIELDVWLTKDNRVVVLHDGDLERVTGVQGHVNSTAYDDLPLTWRKPSDGWNQGYEGLPKDIDNVEPTEPIPLLTDVLDAHCGSAFIIEFKEANPILVEAVHTIITERGLVEKGLVTWFSLKSHIQHALAVRDPSIPRITSVMQVLHTALLHYVGLLWMCPLAFSIFGVKVGHPSKMLGLARKISIFKLFPESIILSAISFILNLVTCPTLLKALRRRAYPYTFSVSILKPTMQKPFTWGALLC